MDKEFIYPIFWNGGLYTSRTRLGKEDHLLLKDDNGNLFNVPASEVSETDEIFDAECAEGVTKPSPNGCIRWLGTIDSSR